MKNIKEILSLSDTKEIIQELKKKTISIPEWRDLVKEYEPKQHKIFDKAFFPDKPIKNDNGEIIRFEPVTRVGVGLQKLAVKRMSEFMFTIPALPVCEEAGDGGVLDDQFDAVKKVLKKNKWRTLNKKRCKIISSQCEQATYWYVVKMPRPINIYGFESEYKLKCTVFCPENGDALFPLFDETGDMIAFSREFSIVDDGKTIGYFETWTDEKYYRWSRENGASEWKLDTEPALIQIGKIPIVYGHRNVPIWQDADNGKVTEIELLLSRNGDIIAYHAAPVLIIKGELKGAPSKNEANKVFTTESGGGAEYVSWTQSPDSVRFQFETLLRMYHTELQLPDLSFESVKGMGATSGEARKWVLADAHLKVGDESEIYEDIIDREYSIIKAYLGQMNKKAGWDKTIDDLEIETEITPWIISDDKSRIELLIAANGGKPVTSQELSAELAGLAKDPKADWEKIKAEFAAENTMSISEPTF